MGGQEKWVTWGFEYLKSYELETHRIIQIAY